MTQTPSSGAGATPAAGSPATGIPAAGSATPQPATLTLEEALKQIADLKQHAQNKESEAAHHGKKLSAAEKELEAYKAAEQAARDAQMSELEKVQKVAADLQERHDTIAAKLLESNVRQDVADKVDKFNFRVSARTVANFLLHDWDAIEFDDATGEPTNTEKLLEKLAKNEPGIVKDSTEQQQQQRGAPAVPAFNPGRSSIQAPGTTTPGKKPSWSDVKWSGQ